jgi:hypothetical protein
VRGDNASREENRGHEKKGEEGKREKERKTER